MKSRVFSVLAVIACAALLYGCNPREESPTAPSVNVCGGAGSCGGNQGNTGGGPTASPSPGSGSGLVATVTINGFGQRCPAGIAPATGTKEVRVGCELDVTVNPRRTDGSVIFDTTITGVEPELFQALYGRDSVASFTISDENSYNAEVRGLSAGRLGLQARVKGVTSAVTEFTVVN